jgi:MFS family permease
MSRQQEVLFNIMVAVLQLIPQSTLTTVFPVSRDIARSFSISNPSVLPWLVAAYALSFGTFILIGGRLGDIFGHKAMVVIGYSWLSFWSVVAGLSHYAGYQLFFVARGFQGLGASLMVPNGLALLGRTYPPGSKQKGFAFTLFGLCAPVGAYLGMLFGALFTKYATWWWSFYALAIVCCFLAIASTAVLISPPPTPKQMLPVKDKLRDMDWLGALTGVGGLICIQVSLVSAPAAGWSTQYVFMLLIIGLLLIAFFVITEIKIAEQPLVPFKMLKADVGFVLGAVACGWATFGIWTWFLWKFLLGIKQYAPLEAAVHVLPIVPVALIASILTAWMMRKCRPSWTLFWALVAFAFGPLLLAVDSNIDKTTYWSWTFASLVVMPFGMDMSFPAATLIMSNYFPPQQQGVAGSLISTVVNYSISLGLGLASTVEVQVNNHGLHPLAGIRGGWFMGVGLGGLGVLICIAFVIKSIFHPTPTMSSGPPGPPVAGTAMKMTPQEPPQDRKLSRHTTVSSLATTMVPDTPGGQTPKQKDCELFKSFDFDMASIPASPSAPAPASPKSQSSSGLPNTSSIKQKSPKPAPLKKPPRNSNDTPHSRYRRKDTLEDSGSQSHSRSESQVHLQAQSSQIPMSPSPRIRLPTEPDAAYRARGSFESEDADEERQTPHWDLPARRRNDHTQGQAREDGYEYGYGYGSGLRDADGFGHDAKPVIPRGMMGDKF